MQGRTRFRLILGLVIILLVGFLYIALQDSTPYPAQQTNGGIRLN